MKMNKHLSKKGMKLALSLIWILAGGILLFFSLVSSAAAYSLQEKSSLLIFGDDKMKIESISHVGCKGELADVLIKLLNSEIVVGDTKMKMNNFIFSSDLSDSENSDLFESSTREIFEDAFPKESWEGGAHPWWVRVQKVSDKTKNPNTGIDFNAGAFNCDVDEDITAEIVVGENKIIACLTKTYCNEK
jgi:hypothetical protein